MGDFASTVMIRILAAGMRLHGMTPPALPAEGARVTLGHKRELVASAVAQGGWACLPLLGQGVEAIRGDPVHQALVGCTTAVDLLERWCRLERYIHSRHRIRVAADSAGGLRVSHHSLRSAEPPLPAENLVVLGVLAAALQEAGLQQVHVAVAGTPIYPQGDAVALQAIVAAGQTDQWHFRWQEGDAHGRPWQPVGAALDSDILTGPALARKLGRIALDDLMQVPPLAQAARQLGMAQRSLQRQLAASGLSYSGVVTEVRCRAAAWHLMRSADGPAGTGFVCGFSDQAHFTRVFHRQVGVPPSRYRKEFGPA